MEGKKLKILLNFPKYFDLKEFKLKILQRILKVQNLKQNC